MINNLSRIGNFTSSEIGNLMKKAKDGKGFGTPALTYIEETNMERRLNRSLTDEVNARPLTWGKLLESRAFDQLGLEYSLVSTETIVHPDIPYWAGSPDGRKEKPKTIVDIKCPITLKSFCQLVDAGNEGGIAMIRASHPSGDKYFWQIVSNAILDGADYGELIVYMPYKSELAEIKLMAQNVPGEILGKHYWIAMAGEDELPFILDGGHYKNINVFSFEITEADKAALTDAVLRAGKMLINQPKALAAPDDSTPYEMVLDDPNALKI